MVNVADTGGYPSAVLLMRKRLAMYGTYSVGPPHRISKQPCWFDSSYRHQPGKAAQENWGLQSVMNGKRRGAATGLSGYQSPISYESRREPREKAVLIVALAVDSREQTGTPFEGVPEKRRGISCRYHILKI